MNSIVISGPAIRRPRSNAALLPETLFGAELGLDVVAENARFGVSCLSESD